MSKKDLSTLLTTEEKVQSKEVTPRNQEKQKRPLETGGSRNIRRGSQSYWNQCLRSRQMGRELSLYFET